MDKINDISTKIAKLDYLINSNFEFIKTRIEDIKFSEEEENTENENNSNNISFQISLKEINNSLDDIITNINISIIMPRSIMSIPIFEKSNINRFIRQHLIVCYFKQTKYTPRGHN